MVNISGKVSPESFPAATVVVGAVGVGVESAGGDGEAPGVSVGTAVGDGVGPCGLPDEAGAPPPVLPPPVELAGASAEICAATPLQLPPAASCTVTVG